MPLGSLPRGRAHPAWPAHRPATHPLTVRSAHLQMGRAVGKRVCCGAGVGRAGGLV